MFRTAPAAEPAADVTNDLSPEPIPLSVLDLDLSAPVEGWRAFLADRHIKIVVDDLGRSSVSRNDARRLFDEHRDEELRKAECVPRRSGGRLRPISSFGLRWVLVFRLARFLRV